MLRLITILLIVNRIKWQSKDIRNIDSALDEAEVLLARFEEGKIKREDKRVDDLIGAMARNFFSGGQRQRQHCRRTRSHGRRQIRRRKNKSRSRRN